MQLRAQAVVVLKRAGDEELSQYLLQLSAALRYEAKDDSKLASFLLQRCALLQTPPVSLSHG